MIIVSENIVTKMVFLSENENSEARKIREKLEEKPILGSTFKNQQREHYGSGQGVHKVSLSLRFIT